MSALGVVMPVYFPSSLQIPDVHCTLIYLGEEGKVSVDKQKVEAAVARLNSQIDGANVAVTGVEVFGNGRMTVLTLDDITLGSWRKFIDRELRRDGIVSASEYKYRPHITINKHDESKWPIYPWAPFRIPPIVWVEKPCLWWGSERKNR